MNKSTQKIKITASSEIYSAELIVPEHRAVAAAKRIKTSFDKMRTHLGTRIEPSRKYHRTNRGWVPAKPHVIPVDAHMKITFEKV